MNESITFNNAQYALDLVKTICTQVGPGLPGSSQEKERAAIIKERLESHLGVANVSVEEFTCAPDAFLNPDLGLLMIITALLNIFSGRISGISPWLMSGVALALSIIAPLIFLIEFFFGVELIDRFFKKKQSVNVVGRLVPPENKTVKRVLILSGHHDSAPENIWLLYLKYGFFALSATFIIGLVTLLVINIIQLIGLIAGNANIIRLGTLGWALLVYPVVPAIIFALFPARWEKSAGTVPGAADNLSACALVTAMCRYLANNPECIPEDTEIRFITFGSEEAGCRGSRRYVARHLEELKRLDVRVLNYETIAHPEVVILTSETNGSVKNSPEMVKSVVAAAQRARVPYRVKPATLGTGSDAGPFSQAGLKATTLIGFNTQQMVAFYHQRSDQPEVLTADPLLNVLKLTLEWVRNGGE